MYSIIVLFIIALVMFLTWLIYVSFFTKTISTEEEIDLLLLDESLLDNDKDI